MDAASDDTPDDSATTVATRNADLQPTDVLGDSITGTHHADAANTAGQSNDTDERPHDTMGTTAANGNSDICTHAHTTRGAMGENAAAATPHPGGASYTSRPCNSRSHAHITWRADTKRAAAGPA